MAMTLTPLWRLMLDRLFSLTGNTLVRNPAITTAGFDNTIYKGSDMLFPVMACAEHPFVAPAASTLQVMITQGFCRDANGAIVEMPLVAAGPSVAVTAPTSGKSQVYVISFDPVAKTYSYTAGVAANTGTQVAPATPSGQIPIATFTVANGDTVVAASRIDNTYRLIF